MKKKIIKEKSRPKKIITLYHFVNKKFDYSSSNSTNHEKKIAIVHTFENKRNFASKNLVTPFCTTQ